MNVQEFEERLRTFLRRRPFVPFTVVLNNGERIEVDVANSVAFGGGAGGYIGPDHLITFFECENVNEIVPVTLEAAS